MIAAVTIILALLAQPGTASASAQDLSAEGWQLWQSRKLVEAEAKFDQAVKADPKLTAAWNGLGWARLNQGKRDGAEKAFAEVIKLEPEHGAALNGLGWINFGRRKYDEAEKHFLAAAANNASAAWAGLAQLYLLQGKYEQALPWALLLSKEQGADPVLSGKMIDAAKAKKLDPALRKQIEPEDEKKS